MLLKPKRLFNLSIVSAVVSILEGTSNSCNYNVKIKQHLHNDGFHRNLTYAIDFINDNQEWSWIEKGNCIVGLEQIFPSGAYTSPDEMEKYYNNYFKTASFKNPVNIELPADSATPVIMHLLLQIIDYKILFSIPVHGRYHPAIAGGGKAEIEFPLPKLYLNCQDKRLDDCPHNREITRPNNFCSKEISRELCNWKEPLVDFESEPISFEVPVGNTDHYYIVAVGTIFFVTFGTTYLLKAIHDYQVSTRKTNKNSF